MEPEKKKIDDDCPICLDTLSFNGKGKTLLKTRCEHVFHRKCLLEWLKNGMPGNFCPLCKRACTIKETIPVAFGIHSKPTRRSRRITSREQVARAKALVARQSAAVAMSLSGEDTSPIMSFFSGRIEDFEQMLRSVGRHKRSMEQAMTRLQQQLSKFQRWLRRTSEEPSEVGLVVEVHQHIDQTQRVIANVHRECAELEHVHTSLMQMHQNMVTQGE